MRILAITPRVLEPANTGGRIRSRRLLEHLSRLHETTLICLRTKRDTDSQIDAMRGCCTKLQTIDWSEPPTFSPKFYRALATEFFNPLPHTVLKYRSSRLRDAVATALNTDRYDVLLCDFLHMSINCRAMSFRPKVLFQHNVESEIRHSLASHASNPLARAYLRRDATKMERFERSACASFQHCIMVSDDDCQTMTRLYGVTHVSAIPSAVDTSYFSPLPGVLNPACVFLGSMDMLANQDAVTFFTRRILPRIRQSVPATFCVVGRNPPRAIRRLQKQNVGVTVTGTVDDVRPHLASAQVLVVPLRIGGGTRIKIFEAMAMGIPVVSTRLGAAGLPVTHGHNILLADSPEEFAEAAVRVMRSDSLRRGLSVEGRRLVESDFTWSAAAARVSSICLDVVARHNRAATSGTSR